jgi:MurNAc alpha-1-phosphate uridylyltransferase
MKAMILAAGRGERMRPLTDRLPKPLLKIAGKSLIEYHIEALVSAGVTDIIINHAWLGAKIEAQLGDGACYGAKICYSHESQALETAGGIKQALAFFSGEPFIVVNGDVFSDYPFTQLIDKSECLLSLRDSYQAYLVLVNNPEHHPEGDFYCIESCVFDQYSNTVLEKKSVVKRYTYSGIACYHPDFFTSMGTGKHALAPMLREAMGQGQVMGEVYKGKWWDIGTPQRLEELNTLYTCST